MSEPVIARELKADYVFAGPGAEIDKTLPLQPDEQSILQGRAYVAYHRPAMFAGIGYVRLTSHRLCIKRLRALSANRILILEIPPGAYTGSSLRHVVLREALGIEFRSKRGADGVSLLAFATLRPGTDTRAGVKATFADHLGRVERDPMRDLSVALQAWANGA